MKNTFPLLLVIFTFVGCNSNKKETTSNLLPYPETRKTDHIDTYFGTEVADPYRWLEDDNSEETKNWVTNQNQLTSEYLQNISYKKNIKERLMELENYGKVSAPFKHNGIYYMYKNDGLQNQNVLYSMTTLQEEPTVFLDPNKFSNDGTISLAGTSWSKDGRYMAYMV
ncbi:MAG: S9 family peptidase, partial [Cyclobacteriaceae bacterium]|nr:S9 family peptidase [Cyclobacteriaceae bacterium]